MPTPTTHLLPRAGPSVTCRRSCPTTRDAPITLSVPERAQAPPTLPRHITAPSAGKAMHAHDQVSATTPCGSGGLRCWVYAHQQASSPLGPSGSRCPRHGCSHRSGCGGHRRQKHMHKCALQRVYQAEARGRRGTATAASRHTSAGNAHVARRCNGDHPVGRAHAPRTKRCPSSAFSRARPGAVLPPARTSADSRELRFPFHTLPSEESLL